MINEIKILPKAFMKLKYYTNSTSDECGGFIYFEDGMIVDVDLPLQEVSRGSVDFDDEMIAQTFTKLAEEQPEKLSQLKGWWHSHNSMEPFLSPTDGDCIERLMRNQDYIISIVTAHGEIEEWKIFVTFGKDNPLTLEVKLGIEMIDEGLGKKCVKELKRNCRASIIYDIIPKYVRRKIGLKPKYKKIVIKNAKKRGIIGRIGIFIWKQVAC